MRILFFLISIAQIFSCAAKESKIYIGSTPADPVVRKFLSIPLSDSVDFIRWKLIIEDDKYTLQCNYGIGKPNTNGFYDGGKKIEINGTLEKNNTFYSFQSGSRLLKMAELNQDLFHILDEDNRLLVGNGGWSYTLNNIKPVTTDQINITAKNSAWKDSVTYDGRTPCKVPGIIPDGKLCYKLKWRIILYANAENNSSGTYKVLGTPWREAGARKGKWNIVTGKDGRISYQLYNENEKGFLFLLKLDENILVFTDQDGKLLTGDEDFSYTLNRKNY
jgi:hypothetical protein